MNPYMPSYLKTKNRMRIFELFRAEKELSRAAIVRMTGMSFPTVLKAVDKLLELGVLIELEEMEAPSGAGRRGHLLRFNGQAFWAAGAVFEGRAAYVGLVDLSGSCRHCSGITLSDGGRDLKELDLQLRRLLSLAASEGLSVLGTGLGFPAMVNPLHNTILHMSSLDIRRETAFSQRFPRFLEDVSLPFFLDNDVNLACLGEAFLRRHDAACRNLIYATLGTGFGAGIVLDGSLWYGCGNKSGEIGAMPVSPFCGAKPAALEERVSLDAIERRFHIDLRAFPQPPEALREEITAYLCPYLSYALALPALLLDLERCTLTGITPLALGPSLLQNVQEATNRILEHTTLTIEPSVSKHAGIVGAAATVFNHCLPELLSE